MIFKSCYALEGFQFEHRPSLLADLGGKPPDRPRGKGLTEGDRLT